MGIQQTKSLLKTFYSKGSTKDPDDYLQKGFCPEALHSSEFLESFWDNAANEYFDWTNIQENKKTEEVQKEKDKWLLREKHIVPDLPQTNSTLEAVFSIEPVAEYKEAYNPPDSKYFSTTFIKRMNILLIAYVKRILSTYNENSTLECISKYFDSLNECNTHKYDVEIGMNLFVRVLEDISEKNTKLKEETLDFLISNAQFVRPLAFWGETKRHFLLDKAMNEIVNYLKKIISNKSETPIYRQKAFKILLNLGLSKGSLKNLLDFTDYYKYIDEYIDFNYEFNLFKNEFIKLSLSYPETVNVKVKSKLWGFKSSTKKKEGEEASKSDSVSLTNDGSFIYLFSTGGYLAKIGTGYNNTMLGKVYLMKENYRQGEKGTIALVDNILYYRSSNLDPNPLICLDPDTLEEIKIVYTLDTRQPNSLWVEGKKNDFEFPHSSYKDMTEIIERKKNFGAEDKSNTRPSSGSPMVTDGRYIYIFSKWYDDVDVNFDKAADDDDDEPKNQGKKTTISIYGVDIYDPLDNMSHVKSVKFNPKTKEEPEDFLKPNTIYYTNGNIFVAGLCKFSLATGEEFERSLGYSENLKIASYDLTNNVIWGFTFKTENNSEKLEVFSYFNHSAKPIVEYPESHDKYMACSLEKIITFTEDLMKVKNFNSEISQQSFIRESTLNILGLDSSAKFKEVSQKLINEDKPSGNLEVYKKATQCLILTLIAKLSEYYGQVPDMKSANTFEERGRILAQATRRPYCVKLEPEIFETLIRFIEEFSANFLALVGDKEEQKLNSYCLLSVVKILRTNLNCLSISNLELDLFIKDKQNNPFLKMKEFIFKIFSLYHENTSQRSDIIKALYEECKIILHVSANTLYPDYNDIIYLLEREIQNFKNSEYSKDVVKCILEWMSNEENMQKLLANLKKDEVDRIFKIFEVVSSWEVNNFANFISNLRSLKNIPKYSPNNDDEIIAFKFSSNMQMEILKSLSRKLLNDNYDEIENEQSLYQISTIIFENVQKIFKSIRDFLSGVETIIEKDWDSIYSNSIDNEEVVDTCAVPISKSDTPSLEEYKKQKLQEVWTFIVDRILSNDLLILRTFSFHVDSLSILSSNFIISSLMLNSYHGIIEEMNQIYTFLKQYSKNNEERTESNEYKEVIFESEHPYLPGQTKWFTLDIPGEKEIYLEFDSQSSCKQNCAYVQLWTENNMQTYAFPQFTNITTNFPKETLHYANAPLHLYFYTDSCANTQAYYGFKVKVHNGKNNSTIRMDDKFTALMRSVCWVACKCSAQLLRGNFNKTLTQSDEDDQKYNNLLNSKLFAGGIDFEDIRKDNDALLSNIIRIFDGILVESEHVHKNTTEKTLINSILQGEGKNINRVLEALQKKFAKEVVWAKIGGDQAERLVRAAFAALLRHSGNIKDFEEVLDYIDFREENEEENEAENINSTTINSTTINSTTKPTNTDIFDLPATQLLYKKWQVASRMRTWLVEKKKNVDEALEKSKPSGENQSKNEESSPEKDSEEIMKKIIDQTIIKAKFLIKLNPSPAFTSEKEDHVRKISLVRSSSIEDPQSDDSWKRRLHQWRAVQKSKKVLRSVEEEANEKFSSLSSSVLMCLQSTISSKRLFNKIKISTIRAKGREIGLLTITRIFEIINHPSLVEDLLSWFCNSLRKTETKICHYLDGVSGCGKYFEERIQFRFQEFIILLIHKLIKAEKSDSLKSFVDALMWKYSSNDHKFLVDQGVFLILWGTYNEAIKDCWGKPLKKSFELSEERKGDSFEFTNSLLEVFELLSNICLDKATHAHDKGKVDKVIKAQSQVNIKFPTLEKQTSIIDESNSESLVRHILDVIFGEISKAITSYLRNRGISYRLWKQYLQYEEEKGDEKKKKKETTSAQQPAIDSSPRLVDSALDDIPDGSEERRDSLYNVDTLEQLAEYESTPETNLPPEKKEKGETTESPETPFWYDISDTLSLYDEYRFADLKKTKKNYISANSLLNIIYTQNSAIYDSDYLNRVLTILLKCSVGHSDKILFSMANPLNFASLFKLLRLCSTENKILIVKILQNVCLLIPEEILTESVDLFLHSPEGDAFILKFAEKRKSFADLDKKIFIELLLDLTEEIRLRAWTNNIDSAGGYLVSSELVTLIGKLSTSEQWSDCIKELFVSISREELNRGNHLRKEILLGVFGGDYYGGANGAQVRVKADGTKGLSFDFIKKDFKEHFNFGTIIGYSQNMEEVWNKKLSKDNKKKKQSQASVTLSPQNTIESTIAVLLHDSIMKEDFNLMDLNPKIFNQHEVLISQKNLNNTNNLKREDILPLINALRFDKSETAENVNFKANIIRFLGRYTQTENGIDSLLEEEKFSEILSDLVNLATRKINHRGSYMNLDLLEEKRFRIINFCAENNLSLSEIPELSCTFRRPNLLIVRLSAKNMLNLTFQILGANNYENLTKIENFLTISDEFDSSEPVLLVPNEQELEKSFNKKGIKLVITHSIDLKSYENRTKKSESTAYISLELASYQEIQSLVSKLKSGESIETTETYRRAFSNDSEDLIYQLEEFGFSKELIAKEISMNKEALDFNTLISNLLEYKEKINSDIENNDNNDNNANEIKIDSTSISNNNQNTIDESKEEEEIENENKNECFNITEVETKVSIPEYFEELIIGENEDGSLLFKKMKSVNEQIIILHSRRIVLKILNKLLDESYQNNDKYKFSSILAKIPVDFIVSILKLLTHEGLFLNSINWGSDLLLEIKALLTKIYTSSLDKSVQISHSLTSSTLQDLETILKGKNTTYEFVSRNEELVTEHPMIFFSIWNLMVMNENSKKGTDYTSIFNVLSGLVTKIIENKHIRWFILDLLIQFVYVILQKLKEDPSIVHSIEKPFKEIVNVNKLRIFLDKSLLRESKKNFANISKRSQMICELLIYIEELDNRLQQITGKNEDTNLNVLLDSNMKKDNFVKDLLTTFEMMKDFFDKKYLKYLAWTEMNPEIINSSKINFESSHLYPKVPHTFLINMPNTTSLEVTFSPDTLLDNGDAIVFSLDKNSLFPVECYSNRASKKNFTIGSSHSFVHFPSPYLTEMYSFGYNSFGRLGHTGSDIFTPKLIDSLSSCVVKDVAIGESFVMVLTQNGDLLSCGNGNAGGLKTTSNTFTKAATILLPEKINSEGISVIGVNVASTIVANKDYAFYSIGMNANGQLGQAWTSPVNDITSMNFTKRIKQIAVGDTHSMLVSFEGAVYHIGNNDYYQNGEHSNTRNNTPKLLSLNKSLTCEMVSVGEYFTIFLMKDIVSGKKKLYSSGWKKYGRTGCGKDEDTHIFKLISNSDIDNLEFKYIASGKNSSAAISTSGKIFTWGQNLRGQLGLGHYNDVPEPTLVTFFDKYEVESVSMSSDHTLVIAKDNEKNKVSVFGFGDTSNGRLGETITQKSEKKDSVPTPVKISFFEGKNPSRVIAGHRASLVLCKTKSYESVRDIHNVACSLCTKTPIVGNLYAEIDSSKTYCSDCIKIVEMSEKNPRILLKTPLKDYSVVAQICKNANFQIEEATNVNCKNCKESIPVSKGVYIYQENKSRCYLCNSCIDYFPSCVTSAKLYLRSFQVIKNIDILNINNFYDNSISYGHKFTVTPILNEKGSEAVIEKHSVSFNNFVEDINEYNKFEVFEQLVDLLNNISQKAEKSIFTYSPKDLQFKKEELSVRHSIEKCSSELLRKLFVILKIFNNKINDLIPFIDFSKVLQDNQRLSYYFNKITPLVFWDTKNAIIKHYLEKTSTDYEVSEVKVNRMKIRRFIEKGKPDHTGEYTIFGTLFQFLKNKPFKIFRKKTGGNSNKMFNVTFVGEASIDAGGPYREALTQACGEIQSSALPLLIPSPNQKNESGLNREKWVINPSAKTTTHLEMYKVLGGLIGYAMRTGEFMNLDLSSIFWKSLLEANLDRKDLELIDRYTIQCLDDIINIHKKDVTPETFSFFVDQKFTTCLSDGTEVELMSDGKDMEVTYHNRVKYCELVEKIRLDESKIQMAAIRSGLEQVIPIGLLKLLSWKELETLVCGKPIMDVDLLKENTIYRGCSESETVIQFLWKCLEEFTAEERSMYLRFVWGRSRLPLTSKDFSMKHRVEILHHNNPDVALPTSHTCFFSLEVPKYSSYEILKEKLKYAISNCQAIDTDGRPYEIWQDED